MKEQEKKEPGERVLREGFLTLTSMILAEEEGTLHLYPIRNLFPMISPTSCVNFREFALRTWEFSPYLGWDVLKLLAIVFFTYIY